MDLPLAMIEGLVIAAFSVGWAVLAFKLEGRLFPWTEETPPLFPVMFSAAIIAGHEELLFRGVAWTYLSRAGSVRTALLWSAATFALPHMLNGHFEYAAAHLPHRFLVGLALGWLRLRTGSLWPPIVAHATLNTIAGML